MISAMLAYGGKYLTVVFPCTENELAEGLRELDAVADIHDMWVHVFVKPKEFYRLEQQSHNLDELNYLAKRMDSFSDRELHQFYAAMSQEKLYDIQALINLTFNLNRYTVVQDIGSPTRIGFAYALDGEGALLADDRDNPRYEVIGKELISSGRGILTEHGMLFVHDDNPFEEVYDGHVFPPYDYYGNSMAEVVISYGGKEETLYLPDDQAATQKAVWRLGAASLDDCSVEITEWNGDGSAWHEKVSRIEEQESLFAVNWLLHQLRELQPDMVKLLAAMERFDVTSTNNIVILAEHCNEFGLAEGVCTAEDVGRYFVENDADYMLHPEMEDYFDYDGFGEHLEEYLEGAFVTSGFLYNDGDNFLCDIEAQLTPEEDPGIQMGGI